MEQEQQPAPGLPSLRALAFEAQQLISMVEQSGGELTPELEGLLSINTAELATKVDHYGHVLKRIPVILEYWRDQRKEADAVVQGLKGVEERLKTNLKQAILDMGRTTLEGETIKFTVGRATPRLEVNEAQVPPDYFIVETRAVVDKDRIKACLEQGQEVPGAQLVQGFRLTQSKNRKQK